MKKIAKLFIVAGTLLLVSAPVSGVNAQVLKFELTTPADQIQINGQVQVNILINTAGQQAINGDALFNFNPAEISVDSANSGDFFTYFSATPLGGSSSKYLVSSWEESVAHAKSTAADTLFATLDLTLKASSATLSFDCTNGTESDSNINRASDSTDIIVCPLQPITISVGGVQVPSPTTNPTAGTPSPSPTGGVTVPTNTPTPTNTPVPTNTPQPTSTPVPTNTPRPTISELPRSGTFEVTIFGLAIGVMMTMIGILLAV